MDMKKLTGEMLEQETKRIELIQLQRAQKLVGKKYDKDKAPTSLLPTRALTAVSEVLGFGAGKYGKYNWRSGMDHTRLSSAAIRHIFSYLEGEDNDHESGKESLAHAACCILMLLESRISGYGTDDRFKEGK